MTVGERIRQIRKENGLTLKQFAERIKINFGSVSKLESGENNPADRTIALICREFDIREEWLRTGDGAMKNAPKDFDLSEYLRNRGATELELRIIRAYYSLPERTRREIRAALTENLIDLFPPENQTP